jgi:hypothetical protein
VLVEEPKTSQFQLSLLVINESIAGPTAGEQILIDRATEYLGDIGIDPHGRFVVFTKNNKDGLPCLFFQSLDISGPHPNGSKIVLVRNVTPAGLDVLTKFSIPTRANLQVTMPTTYPSKVRSLTLSLDGVKVGDFLPGSSYKTPVTVGLHSIDAYGGLLGDYECDPTRIWVPIEEIAVKISGCGWI